MKIIRKWFHCACIVIAIFSFVTFSVSLPTDVLGDSLSRIHFSPWGRNESVTNEPQRTSAGRLIFSVF